VGEFALASVEGDGFGVGAQEGGRRAEVAVDSGGDEQGGGFDRFEDGFPAGVLGDEGAEGLVGEETGCGGGGQAGAGVGLTVAAHDAAQQV
jgi:hypothetical protein